MLSAPDAASWIPDVAKAVAAVATAVTPVIVWATHRKVKRVDARVERVDDAVNHRHEKADPSTGEVPPKLYDLALDNHHVISHLKGGVLEIRGTVAQIQDHHDVLVQRVIEHVSWEEGTEQDPGKYGLILDRLDSLESKVVSPWVGRPDD